MLYFYFCGFGNFSHDYGWDSGISYVFAEMGTEKEFMNEPESWFTDVRETWFNEHGGSRSSDIIVRAEDLLVAISKAKAFGRCYYPEHYQDN